MTVLDFLRAVWPASGVYALATPFQKPGMAKPAYAHKVFDSIEAAARYAEAWKHRTDLYFAVHTLREPKVWDPLKPNHATGELGAWAVRVQSNMAEAQSFFFDLDVGDSPKKYASRSEALQSLKRFCAATGLPRPLITSSGGGLHVYWPLVTPMPSPEWQHQARILRKLADQHGLRADPARTTDTASVLRVAGTFNFKQPHTPRPVEVLLPGVATPTGTFLRHLSDAATRAGQLVAPYLPPAPLDLLGSNTEEVFDGPPVTLKAMLTACAQVRHLVTKQADVSEPEWYHLLNLVRFVERGDVLVHKVSERHPRYDAAATEAKVAQLVAKQIKPTSCTKLADVAGDARCIGCAFYGKVKSPIVAARFKDPAPPVTLTVIAGPTVTTTTIPDPPKPFTRLKTGGVAVVRKTRDGDEEHTVFLTHDLYPIRRLTNTAAGQEQQLWRVHLPRAGAKDFLLDADALYDRRKFVAAIAHQGIYPTAANVPYLQDYMIAYIAELQRQADADPQCTHLGWTDDRTGFILPDKILLDTGSAKAATLALGAQRAAQHVHAKGDPIEQVRLLQFYNHPAYRANQFFITAALAAPIFYATGHHGVIVNASGEAGASKSTSLYTAASLWGQPELYPINGTNNGATVRGRNERVTTLANLPVCVDEITHMPVKDAIDLAMSITQPGHRIRLDTSGVERSHTGGYKATIMLSTANNSLHGLLSTDNAAGTAGSMRVFEIPFSSALVHSKPDADAYWHGLKQHYGHLGERFMHHVLQHRVAVEARVRELMKEIDLAASIQSSERFWSATVAAVLAASEISEQLGLLPFSTAQLKHWAITQQIPHMRGTVLEQYATPTGLLADFLQQINGEILICGKPMGQTGLVNIVHAPRGQLLGHYDTEAQTLWILKKAFKDYCTRLGASMLKTLDDLHRTKVDLNGREVRVVASKHVRKVLGAGTEYAKAQAWCFAINMAHPEITGAVETHPPRPTAPHGHLKLA